MKFLRRLLCFFILFITCINTAFASSLSGKWIVIDPGHGGSDPGAVSGNVKEKDINNSVARKLGDLLKSLGAEVVFTRLPEEDIYITLQDRVNISNSVNPSLFISLHCNAASSDASGVETYYSKTRPNIYSDRYVEYEGNKYEYLWEEKENGIDYVYILVDNKEAKVEKSKVKIVYSQVSWQAIESQKIAKLIVDNLASLGFKNRGAKDSNLYVTKYTTSPSVLVELGFITNEEERKKLLDPNMQDNIARKITDALLSYFEVYENNKLKAFGQNEGVELLLSKENLLLGQALDISVKKSQIFSYNYKLEIKYLGKVDVALEDINKSFTYLPQKEGDYEVVLYVKGENESDYKSVISKKFYVFKSPNIKSITLDQKNPVVNKSLKITVEKNYGSAKGCDYIFEIYKDNKLLEVKKLDGNLLEFIPRQAGEYNISVKIKDKLSTKQVDDEGKINFIVRDDSATSRSNTLPNVLKITRILKRGMIGEDVRNLQSALIKLGYLNIKSPTTSFGALTESAVKAFQRANNLKADGIVKKDTVDRINLLLSRSAVTNTNIANRGIFKLTITRTLKRGMIGEDVRNLQSALIKLGYLNIKSPTTSFGALTESAVKAFQRANNLKADGIVKKDTVDRINLLLIR